MIGINSTITTMSDMSQQLTAMSIFQEKLISSKAK